MGSAVRKEFAWKLRSRSLALGRRTLIMGVLNATPDSFSDGGEWTEVEAAIAHGLEMLDEGADLLDLGGESTRPNAALIAAEEEQARVMPVLRGILRARPDAVLSIDTFHAQTAQMALDAGAEIVNDVSGFLWEPALAKVCAVAGCGVVLMHTRGKPQEWRSLPALAPNQVVPLVKRELAQRAATAVAAGVPRESIVLDPGFGFGKAFDENFPLLAGLPELHALGFPLLAGVSRKGFLRRAIERLSGSEAWSLTDVLRDATIAGNVAAVLGGAHILRAHDVAPARRAAAVADSILAANTETS